MSHYFQVLLRLSSHHFTADRGAETSETSSVQSSPVQSSPVRPTDASYFRVVGWGYYYMVTVMDDYSRFILAHRLQRDITSDSFIV